MQQQGQLPQLVSFRPYTCANRYLYAATDKSNNQKNDFDVRCTNSSSEDTYFLLEQVKGAVYKIRPASQPHHYLFCSNDNTRKYHNDYDVRTHEHQEPRNNWIIENVGWSTYTIRSETDPQFHLFVADDKSNHYKDDFDVRTHAHLEERNLWYINAVPNLIHPYPLKFQPIIVRFRPAHIQQQSLTLGGHHDSFKHDFIVTSSNAADQNTSYYLDRVEGNVYTIRPAASPLYFLFAANDKPLAYGDFDVRLHRQQENRNRWFIENAGNGRWFIKAASNPDHFLFADQNENLGGAFRIKTHSFKEDRNAWFIDGFTG